MSSCSTAACEDEIDQEMADEECAGQESTVSEAGFEGDGFLGDCQVSRRLGLACGVQMGASEDVLARRTGPPRGRRAAW